MIFTLGNAITLVVVVGLVLVFRQLDSKNRSIDKVKKFTDKIKTELDAYFDSRSNALRNAALDLEVKQTQAIVTVKRLESQRAEFAKDDGAIAQKLSSLSKIEESIKSYDEVIEQLMGMTDRADENLHKISAESSRLDKVQKRIAELHEKLDKISAAIPQVTADFAKQNSEQMQLLGSGIVSNFESKAAALQARFEASETRCSDLLVSVENAVHTAFTEAARQAEQLEHDAFAALQKDMEQRLACLNAEQQAALRASNADIETQISSCAEAQTTAVENAREAVLESARSIQTESLRQFDELGRDLRDRICEIENAAKLEASGFLEAVREEIRDFNIKYEDVSSRVATDLDELQRSASGKISEISGRLDENDIRFTRLAAEYEEKISTLRYAMDLRLENFLQDSESRYSSIESAHSEKTAAFEEHLEQLRSGIESQIDALKLSSEQRYSSAENASIEKIAAFEENLERLQNRIESQITAFRQNNEEQLGTIEGSCAEKIASVRQAIDSHIDSLLQSSEQRYSSVENASIEKTAAFEENLELLQNRIESQIGALKLSSEQRYSSAENASTEKIAAFEENLERLQNRIESQVTAFRQNNEREFGDITGACTEKIAALRVAVDAQITSLTQSDAQQYAVIETENTRRAGELEEKLGGQFTALSNRLEKYSAEIEEKISGSYLTAAGSIEKAQNAVFGEIEKHFDAYKSEMLYRFERMEKTASDIDQLDAQLHETIELAKIRVSSDFDTFAKDQEKRQVLFEKNVQDKAQGLSQYMQRIERELNELKSRAYENVSEKLKIFEDDFFADLSKRGDSINTSLIQWRADIENRLNALAAESEDERRKVEVKYAEDVKTQLAHVSEKMREYLGRVDETLKKTEQEGLRRLSVSEESVSLHIEQTRSAFEQARRESEEYLQREFENYDSAAQEQIKKQQDEIASHIRELTEETASARSGANAALDAVRDDFILWRERVNQQFEEARAVFEEKLAGLESNSQGVITQVSESFKADAEGYAAAAREEKLKLSAELELLRQTMQEAVHGFEERSGDTVEEFRKAYENMLEETQHRIREQNAEAEQKLRSLKVMAQEIQEKNEEARQKMVLKMQTDTSNLQMVMDDIDKRLKNFVSQTQLFERADSLKTHLEDQIAALRGDTATLDAFRQTAGELEQQFIKIRRMDDELNQKLQRFAGDRKRIEAMEADFNNLMALSTTIDQKIAELKSTGDDLQYIQLEIRRFQENLSEMGARYERLEKKNDILDRTIMGVDKTFETLSQLEKRLSACSQQTDQLPMRLAELNVSVDRILENDGKIHDAASKLDSLENILGETETRMQNMLKSREWLAKTETRLEEINKQAQSQVKILGDLLKQDVGKKDAGAPPISVRETVIKLFRQGWKVDEIARATHLSRGEVELILELGNDLK